jgi:hypothetical protein
VGYSTPPYTNRGLATPNNRLSRRKSRPRETLSRSARHLTANRTRPASSAGGPRAQCFKVMGGEAIEGCKCHPTCGSCGYNDWPVEENNCISCLPPNFLYPYYLDGSGTCYPPLPPAPPPTAAPTTAASAEQAQAQTTMTNTPQAAAAQMLPGSQQAQQATVPMQRASGSMQQMQQVPIQPQPSMQGMVQPAQGQATPMAAQAQQPILGELQPEIMPLTGQQVRVLFALSPSATVGEKQGGGRRWASSGGSPRGTNRVAERCRRCGICSVVQAAAGSPEQLPVKGMVQVIPSPFSPPPFECDSV